MGKILNNLVSSHLVIVLFSPFDPKWSLTQSPRVLEIGNPSSPNPAASCFLHDRMEATLCFLPHLILLISAHILHHSQLLKNMSWKTLLNANIALPSPNPKLRSMRRERKWDIYMLWECKALVAFIILLVCYTHLLFHLLKTSLRVGAVFFFNYLFIYWLYYVFITVWAFLWLWRVGATLPTWCVGLSWW